MKTAIVLINLGTPGQLSKGSVRSYLKEFLIDPRVIDLNVFIRYLLVYGIIVPFRSKKTLNAYKKIWKPEGSPLRLNTQILTNDLQRRLGEDYKVIMAMRYGNPSIASIIEKLIEYEHIIVIPLFPQYSSAATGSAIAKFMTEMAKSPIMSKITIFDKFYNNLNFISAYAKIIKTASLKPKTHFLFSYHGLPERHLSTEVCKALCDRHQICPKISNENYFCYRAQCYKTSALLADTLSLKQEDYTTSFQSRLGRNPWIKPYTDQILIGLYEQGIRDLVVVCPSFVSDCLETTEEIGIQARQQWEELGGESFALIPCLNNHSAWVDALAEMVTSESLNQLH